MDTILPRELGHRSYTRISYDSHETILVGKFPSCEISEKCASRHSRKTDIQSFLPFHHTQHNVQILAIISLSATEQQRHGSRGGGGSGYAGRRLQHHLCNSELWLAAAAALPRALLDEYTRWLSGHANGRADNHLVSHSYVIVLCLRSSNKWRRQLDDVDSLDLALLTRLACLNLLGQSNNISHMP